MSVIRETGRTMTDKRKWWLETLPPDVAEWRSGEAWVPAADVYRTPDGWLVKLDLAGVAPRDVQIASRGNALRVAGVRRDLQACRGLASYSLEINYHRFEREIRLPVSVESCVIEVESQDGMLLVWLRSRPHE